MQFGVLRLISEEFIEDIKTLFDSIRNIGICAALTIGLPFIEKTMPLVCNSTWLKLSATACTIGVIIGLYILNLIWLFSKLDSKPKSKHFHLFSSFIVMSLISLAIGSTAFAKVWGQLFNYA